MKLWSKKFWRKWLRLIHRDLGYFFVGITIIYAVSGIILNHKKHNEDPAYRTITQNYNLEANLSPDQLKTYWGNHFSDYHLNRIIPNAENYDLYLKGGLGKYNPMSGGLTFEVYEKKQWVYFMNKLHYNSKKGWTLMADIFAVAMLVFALSGMFMVPGKKGITGRGKWLIAIGIIVPFLFFL
ncbi:PepSY-associated TM helix domain-containing protein [Marinifilum caeruleilacunae]|uniref:Peptidase n=1 Tax=Marinifilum caeruleilacunae TaxID=2499076 RepID=A0ABX1WTF8_9BACT|nr:PepSY-associated TM helix domain-containing protein [Marinifilum caeruleilacunae]NOU59399.1 peptidase [Marinifilum caeruleilacunae]